MKKIINSKTFKISFNNYAPHKYWYLYWIGKVIFEDNSFKVKLYFINTSEPSNLFRGFNSKYKQKQIFSVEVLSFLTIGTLYDTELNKFIFPLSYFRSSLKISKSLPFNYNKTAKELPFLESVYTPINNEIDFESFKYYFLNDRRTFKEDGKEVLVITNIYLTSYNLCNYLFFKTSKFVGLLLSEGIHNLFAVESIKIIESNGKRIGILKYNNNKLSYDDVKPIATLFFTSNNKGIKALDAIETRIKTFLINNKDNVTALKSGVYLDTDFPFEHDIKFNFQGRKFRIDDKFYFIVSNIINHENIAGLFLVDEIRLDELYPKGSTEMGNSLDKISAFRPDQPKLLENNLNLAGNSLGNSSANIKDELDGTNDVFEFGIPVKKIIRDTQDKAYDITLIPDEEVLYGATLCTYNPDIDSSNLRLNFVKHFKTIDSISRFELLRLSVEKLNKFGLIYKFNCLENYNLTSEKIYNIYDTSLMIVSLSYKDKYFYLIELEKGYTGFIFDYNNTKISPQTLGLFIKVCTNNLSNLHKGEHIWTKIRKLKEVILKDYGIIIDSPIAHQTKNFSFINEAVDHMAEKIYQKIA